MRSYEPTWEDVAYLLRRAFILNVGLVGDRIVNREVVKLVWTMLYDQKVLTEVSSYTYRVITDFGKEDTIQTYHGYAFEALNELARGSSFEAIAAEVWSRLKVMGQVSGQGAEESLVLFSYTNLECDQDAELSGRSEGLGHMLYYAVKSRAPR